MNQARPKVAGSGLRAFRRSGSGDKGKVGILSDFVFYLLSVECVGDGSDKEFTLPTKDERMVHDDSIGGGGGGDGIPAHFLHGPSAFGGTLVWVEALGAFQRWHPVGGPAGGSFDLRSPSAGHGLWGNGEKRKTVFGQDDAGLFGDGGFGISGRQTGIEVAGKPDSDRVDPDCRRGAHSFGGGMVEAAPRP